MTEFDLEGLKYPLHEYTGQALVNHGVYELYVYARGRGWPHPEHEVVWAGKYWTSALQAERDWIGLVKTANKLLT